MGLKVAVRRIAGAGALALLVSLGLPLRATPSLASPSVAAGARDYDVAGGRYYEQGAVTAGAGLGFVVHDDEAAPLWGELRRLGGTGVVGYPLSRRYACDGAVCQAFQYAVFKWTPGGTEVELLSVFDLLQQMDKDTWLDERWGVPPLAPADRASNTSKKDQKKQREKEDERQRAMIEENGSVKAAYWRLGTRAPTIYGTARAYRVADGQAVLRTQRAALVQPADAPGQVRLLPAGAIFAEAGFLPLEAREPVAAPGPVDATPPTWIGVPEIGIDAPVISMDMGADNLLPVPDDGGVVAWYSYGARLGESGNAVLAGHVDLNGRPGSFWRLRDAKPSQTVTLYGQAGWAYDYRVEWARIYPEDSIAGLAALRPLGGATTITLVTCGGRFDARTRSYEDRHVVRASLVGRRAWEAPR